MIQRIFSKSREMYSKKKTKEQIVFMEEVIRGFQTEINTLEAISDSMTYSPSDIDYTFALCGIIERLKNIENMLEKLQK